MEIKLKKKEVIDLLERYYREIKNLDASVKISAKREPIGRFEVMGTVVEVSVTKTVNILDVVTESKERLSDDEVVGMLNEMLKDTEYLVTSISYDAGVTPVSVGYGMGEHTEYRSYFNGVTLYVKNREKECSRKLV